MMYEIFTSFFQLLGLIYDTVMVLSVLPSLIVNASIVLIAGMFLTKLQLPKGGYRLPNPGKCIAHRGAALDAPENTMAAFKYCVEKGCKHIELDVRVTKDGIPIVWHDQDIQGKLIVANTWDELKNLPVSQGHPMEEKYADATPCTLKEALNFLTSKGVHTIIDMKTWDSNACSLVARYFSEYPNMHNTCMVSAFNPLAVYKIRKIDPNIVGGLAYHPRCFSSFNYGVEGPLRSRFPDNAVKHYAARLCDRLHGMLWWTNILTTWAGCSVVLLHKDVSSPWAIAKWRNRGYDIALWTVNQPTEKRMVNKQFGVTYITDTLIGEDLTNGFIK